MNTIVTMTLDEIERTPLTAEETRIIREAARKATEGKPVDDPDCPVQTKAELAKFRPWYEAHPECYGKPRAGQGNAEQSEAHIKIDSDVLEWFKRQGKGYQTKINAVLRQYAFG